MAKKKKITRGRSGGGPASKKLTKKSKAKALPSGSADAVLRKKFADVMKGIDKEARKLCRRFQAQADTPPTIDEWDLAKEELADFAKRADKRLEKYDAIAEEIRRSSDLPLKQIVKDSQSLRLRALLISMRGELRDQELNALAPLSDEEKKNLQKYIANLLGQAKLVSSIATQLKSRIDALSDVETRKHEVDLRPVRRALEQMVKSGVDLAANLGRDPAESWCQRKTTAIKAIEEYGEVIDIAKKEVQKRAGSLGSRGRSDLRKELEAFSEAVEGELLLDSAIIEALIEALGAAIHLPKAAAQAAQEIVGVVTKLQPSINATLAELSAARGDKSREGDLVDPATICEYSDLVERERIVVDLLMKDRRERGAAATLTVEQIVADVQSAFRATGAGGKSTIKEVVRRLCEKQVLIGTPGDRSPGGHGGALKFRLSEAAAAKYARWASSKSGPAARHDPKTTAFSV
jgi:hypothetical protein